MRYKRILRIATIVISFLIAYLIYNSEYNIRAEQIDIERGIEEFLEKDVAIMGLADVDNIIFVYYTLETSDNIGYAILHKGINFRYQIRETGYNARNRIIQWRAFKTNKGNYLAILGTNYDEKINEISVETAAGEMFSENIDEEKEFLKIFRTKEETYLYKYNLFDNEGQDIADEMEKYITAKDGVNTVRSKTELFMLYVLCFIVILIGCWIFNMFKDKDSRII